MKILVVDDNDINLKVLSLILEKQGYAVKTLNSATNVISTIMDFVPDLLLLDINMPNKSGYDVCKEIKENKKINNIQVIFISALSESDNVVKGLQIGASDYIVKPFKKEEVLARVATHLRIKVLQDELNRQNEMLEERVKAQVAEIANTQMQTIFSLAKLAQSRDDDTGLHLERVQNYCELLAKELKVNSEYSSEIDDDFILNIKIASPLHDIGKVGIADNILLKPGKLTPEEFDIMKTHTIIGYETLNDVDSKFGSSSFIKMGKLIARNHHERFDGNGYPDKLSGKTIPLAARIMAIADVYDALRSKRVYKDAFSQEKTYDIICSESGKQFDPVIVKAFQNLNEQFYNISVKTLTTSIF